MKRAEYLDELRNHLVAASFPHVEEALSYFSEMLDDRIEHENLDEEAAIALLETPEMAAKHLVMQVEQTPVQKPETTATEERLTPGIRTITLKAQGVRSILVSDRNNKILVEGWDRDEVEIQHPETENIRYDTTFENGSFSLVRTPMQFSVKLFNFNFFDSKSSQVLIKAPFELAAAMSLRTSNSKIEVENINCWGKLDLKTSNSSIRLRQVEASALLARISNASVNLFQVRAQKTLEMVTSNGSVKAEKITAPEDLRLQTTNAKIEVYEIESQVITLATSNASIKGDLPGYENEYTIESMTTNGRNSLPRQQTGGDKVLKVRTSNANINLLFRG